jgi:hypothetical protein
MTYSHDIKIVLCLASVLRVGCVWWCEICWGGDFVGGGWTGRHRHGCCSEAASALELRG